MRPILASGLDWYSFKNISANPVFASLEFSVIIISKTKLNIHTRYHFAPQNNIYFDSATVLLA